MARKKRENSPALHRCYECGWYIGSVLLKADHYDGCCPICDSAVDTKFEPTPSDLREMNKEMQRERKN